MDYLATREEESFLNALEVNLDEDAEFLADGCQKVGRHQFDV